MTALPRLTPVFWIGRSKETLSALAEDVRDAAGQALFEAQKGGKHPSAKPLTGHGHAGVLEVKIDHAGNTFRVVYTVSWSEGVYVLHVFQKKSKSGIRTSKTDLALIDARLKDLRELHAEASKRKKGTEGG